MGRGRSKVKKIVDRSKQTEFQEEQTQARRIDALEKEIATPIPESEKKDIVYEIRMNKDAFNSMANAGNIQGLEDYEKYEHVVVNEAMPELTGTPKQIAWAEDIRRNAIMRQIQDAVKPYDHADAIRKQRVDTHLASAKQQGIDVSNLSDMINYLVKENPRGAFKKYKGITSAKQIIDDYTKR